MREAIHKGFYTSLAGLDITRRVQLIRAFMNGFTPMAFCAVLCGCATPLRPNETRITIDSNPPGATIMSAIGNGEAPVELDWTFPPGKTSGRSSPIKARWISGAESTISLNLIAGIKQSYVFQRPANAPNLQADVQWAIHLQQQKAAQDKEVSDAISDFGKTLGSINSKKSTPTTTNCSPDYFGGGVTCNSY